MEDTKRRRSNERPRVSQLSRVCRYCTVVYVNSPSCPRATGRANRGRARVFLRLVCAVGSSTFLTWFVVCTLDMSKATCDLLRLTSELLRGVCTLHFALRSAYFCVPPSAFALPTSLRPSYAGSLGINNEPVPERLNRGETHLSSDLPRTNHGVGSPCSLSRGANPVPVP